MTAHPEPERFGGDYTLLEKIATGGMAEVWRARKYGAAGFQRIVVIKKVLASLAEDEEFIRLFRDEAELASQLQHTNIAAVNTMGCADGEYFIEMEYVHGLDFARLISRSRNQGPFPLPVGLYAVGELLKALEFAHDRLGPDGEPLNLVHCDISPQNVLISYSGEVKLTDFGISRAAFQARSLHQVVRGKYAYMSPEQVEGRTLDRRTDLFSTGIVLYECLTGRRLFKAKTRDETLDRVRRAEVPSPRSFRPEISEDLEAFLLKALHRRPDERFQTADEMRDALFKIMIGEGHRATNYDLAAYLKSVVEAASAAARSAPAPSQAPAVAPRPARAIAPSAVVVLSVEASPPPRSIAAPRTTLPALTQEWAGLVAESGGEIWERGTGSLLVVWVARGGLRASLDRAVQSAHTLQKTTLAAGYRLSAGLAPGVARVLPESRRPGAGWELAGPFYLARWMMNLSAHRGRVLLTEVAARQVGDRTTLLGRIPIQGNRYINLYELA